jgi:hypothetical protein
MAAARGGAGAMPLPAGDRRKQFTPRQKEIIFGTSNGECFYCYKKLSFGNHAAGKYTIGWGSWQIEHLIGWAAGGSDALSNVTAACVDCNQHRAEEFQSGKPESTYFEFMQWKFEKIRCKGFTKSGRRCKRNVALGKRRYYCADHSSGDVVEFAHFS